MKDDLISRQAAIDAVCEDGTQLERQGQYSMAMAERKQRDVDILEAQPTVDAVEVVRCRECRWCNMGECEHKFGLLVSNDENYCSYGERDVDI